MTHNFAFVDVNTNIIFLPISNITRNVQHVGKVSMSMKEYIIFHPEIIQVVSRYIIKPKSIIRINDIIFIKVVVSISGTPMEI